MSPMNLVLKIYIIISISVYLTYSGHFPIYTYTYTRKSYFYHCKVRIVN